MCDGEANNNYAWKLTLEICRLPKLTLYLQSSLTDFILVVFLNGTNTRSQILINNVGGVKV